MDTLHVGDVGTIVYINVLDTGIVLDDDLDALDTRTVKLRRPGTWDIVVITHVPTEVDPNDDIKKLKIVTGSNPGLSLTLLGEFALMSLHPGVWVAEVVLGDVVWTGTTDAFEVFELKRNLV
jgi:hypothetical protein